MVFSWQKSWHWNREISFKVKGHSWNFTLIPPMENAEECLQGMWGNHIKIHSAIFNLILIWNHSQTWFLIFVNQAVRDHQITRIPSNRPMPSSYPWNSGIPLASTAFQDKGLAFFSGKTEEDLCDLALQTLQLVWRHSTLDEAILCNQKAVHKKTFNRSGDVIWFWEHSILSQGRNVLDKMTVMLSNQKQVGHHCASLPNNPARWVTSSTLVRVRNESQIY